MHPQFIKILGTGENYNHRINYEMNTIYNTAEDKLKWATSVTY